MSLYNALFGVNALSPVLLKVLDLDQSGGTWSSGRFRDIYLNEEGTKILLYTRNGGGNREHWSDDQEEGENCGCTGCIISYNLPKHPNYLRDYDDDFDCTYATIEFSIPEEYQADLKQFVSGENPQTVSERFQKLFEDMQSGQNTEETARAENIGKKIFSSLESGDSVISINPNDGDGDTKS